MESQVTALIVHDIKNALAVLEGELQALSREPERERAARALRNCSSLREKLVGFLTLYKASGEGLRARIEPVSPHDFLHALVAGSLHQREDVRVEVDVQDAPALAFFDEHLVGLALDAALQNAMRFARSKVVLGCKPGAVQGIVLSVRDDGPGLGTVQDRAHQSTGLGTELCRAVAAAHRHGELGGTCTLGDAEQGGALFELHLP